jgi:hypothetical protein
MAVLMLSWFAIAFLFALLAFALLVNALVPRERVIVTDLPLALGTTCALAVGTFTSQLAGEPMGEPHPAGFAGGAAGAFVGVVIGALARHAKASLP